MSQLIHATPPPTRTAAPMAVQAPTRAFVAAAWLPLVAAMAQAMAQTISISTSDAPSLGRAGGPRSSGAGSRARFPVGLTMGLDW